METNREILSKHDLHELVRERPGPVISIFIPTERAGSEVQQNRIRLKNALAQAVELCEQRGLGKRDYAKLLEPAHELLDDSPFWQHQSLGLAVFAAPGFFQTFRLPLRFDKRVYVGARFYTKPLLPLLSVDGHFYILAASYGGMRLLLGTRQEVHALEMDSGLAQSVEEFRVRGQQSNVQMRGTASSDGGGTVSHGHDKKAQNERMSQVAYLREWAHAVDRLLGGDNAPLVLVGDEPLLGLLQPMLEYPHVHGETIDRNPEQLSEAKLHELAWPLVEPRFATLKRMASELIERQRGRDGKGVVDTIADVVRAAASGSIEVLFVRKGYSVQGIFDPATGEFSEAWDDDPQASEMANLAASLAIEYGGIVYVVSEDEMPGQVPVVAALRY
jgi:hypothetical protein